MSKTKKTPIDGQNLNGNNQRVPSGVVKPPKQKHPQVIKLLEAYAKTMEELRDKEAYLANSKEFMKVLLAAERDPAMSSQHTTHIQDLENKLAEIERLQELQPEYRRSYMLQALNETLGVEERGRPSGYLPEIINALSSDLCMKRLNVAESGGRVLLVNINNDNKKREVLPKTSYGTLLHRINAIMSTEEPLPESNNKNNTCKNSTSPYNR